VIDGTARPTASSPERMRCRTVLQLTREQAAYPAILSAYDTIAGWLADEGRTPAGSAREIYYPNWDTAAPDEHCVDVAYPCSPAAG
jgi:hypothetical protein